MSKQLNLRKFDLSRISDDSVCVFIGRRRSGKSFLLQDLLYNKRDIPYGVCISPTERASPFFQNFIPKTYIYDEYDDRIVDKILSRQKDMKKKINRDPGFRADPRLCIIMDDCLADNIWKKSKLIRSLFMNGRHYKILYCLTMQYAMGIPPELRGNIDYSFIMREPSYYNRERLFKNYATSFPDFNMFCQVMDQLNKYECLVIDNTADADGIEGQVFWFKADMRDRFRFGCENYWNFHYENYKSDDDDQDFDLSTYKGTRNRTLVKLNKKDED